MSQEQEWIGGLVLNAPKCSCKCVPWSDRRRGRRLSTDHIDIWRVRLDELGKTTSAPTILSFDELIRANRFYFEKDRFRFARCRSALRFLLSWYLEILPSEIRFEYQANGKPELAVQQNPRRLQFNVSHSAGLALIAVSVGQQIGIDVEKIRPDVDIATLAERCFSPCERVSLRRLPDHLRVPAFFACWTRKESFLKAIGNGLSFPLSDFSVTTHPDLDPALEEIRGNSEARKRWFLTDLSVGDGYRATVTVDGVCSRLETYTESVAC